MGLPGCTLFWGESPLDRPVRESQFCENGLDDDLDGVFDCDDPDCAWPRTVSKTQNIIRTV